MDKLLTDPTVVSVVVAGLGWLATKLLGKRADTREARIAAALAQAGHECMQLALTAGPSVTVASLVIQCKGVFAIRLAPYLTERQRAPWQPFIDRAISEVVLRFVAAHPEKTGLALPVAAKVTA
jgi:hypothetical protein